MSFSATQRIHSWFNRRYEPEIIDHDTRITALESGSGGTKGDKGDQGDQGIQGPAGVDGVNGLDGVAGANGLDGTAGADGANGLDGTAGADGVNGKDGVNASPTVSNQVDSIVPFIVTSTETPLTLLSFPLTTTTDSTINAFCSFTIQTIRNTIRDISYTITIGDAVGTVYKHSLGGTGHYATCSAHAFKANQTAGDTTITLSIYASEASVFTVTNSSLTAIGNLIHSAPV